MIKFIAKTLVAAFVVPLTCWLAISVPAFGKGKQVNAQDNLKILMDGNVRYAVGKMEHPRQGAARMKEVAKAQHPIAVVVSCSDSRVPPEIIFDQGVGDIFVVRVAGNVLDDVNIGSVEYAADHLGVPLVVVLGHKRCGAVTAAVEGGHAPGHIGSIMEAIEPAVEQARKMKKGNLVEDAAHINVERAVNLLKNSDPILSKLVKEGKLSVVAAYYDVDTGKVDLF